METSGRTGLTGRTGQSMAHCFETFAWKLSVFCSDGELGECGGMVSMVSVVESVANLWQV